MENNSAPPGAPHSVGKKYILIAEDDKSYARVYEFKLEKEGYEVAIVGNGDELLKAAREKKPNLILLDLIMPVKDGFVTLEELKKDPKLKEVPVMVFSSLGQEEDKMRVMKSGAADYFVKSNVSIQEIVERVKEYIR